MKQRVFRRALVSCLLMFLSAAAYAQAPAMPEAMIPVDPATQGYRVDNSPLKFEEHLLGKSINLRNEHWLDGRYRIANLIADEQGNYSLDRVKKVVLLDAQTGEVRATPYVGEIACLTVDRFITRTIEGRTEPKVTYSGRYGDALEARQGWLPEGQIFNEMSCSFVPEASVPQALSDGRKRNLWRVKLREEHGVLLMALGAPLPANSPDYPPHLRELMSQPFMRTMGVVSWNEKWYLVKPDGQEIPIPSNPGEGAGHYNRVSYVAYKDAYFIPPYGGGRPFDPDELRQIPRFARLLYPDGRVERFGIPDLIWQAYQRKELDYYGYYSRLGMLWRVTSGKNFKNYKGPLAPGFYLDTPASKSLRRMPMLRPAADNVLVDDPMWDGCWVKSRVEIVQERPHFLFNFYYINLCAGPKGE